jgi:CubicO group peptidase (beta-lactamase class C family)
MHDTAFTYQPWFQGRVAAPADDKGAWLAPRFADHPVSADMVYTTAQDYAVLLQAVMENRGISSQIAHERDTVQVSLKEQMCAKLPANLCPDALGSGLSWQIVRFKDITVLVHTGHDPGLFTFAYVSPTAREGAVILTNGENGRKLVPMILRDLNAPAAFTEVIAATFK